MLRNYIENFIKDFKSQNVYFWVNNQINHLFSSNVSSELPINF